MSTAEERLAAESPWLYRLVKAERENRCGDAACMTRRVSAAIRVLTGWKEHQDYCWAIEAFEVELGVRAPELVGAEPSSALLAAALATTPSPDRETAGQRFDRDPARAVARWFTSQPHRVQRAFVFDWLDRHPADRETAGQAGGLDDSERRLTEQWVELFHAHRRGDDLGPIFDRHLDDASNRIKEALAARLSAESGPPGGSDAD